MKLLNDILNNVPEFGQLLAAMDSGRCPVALSGLSAVHRAHFAAGVYARTGRPVVLVCADEGEGERLARDLESLTGQRVPVLAPRSYIFHNAATVSRQWEHRRLALMRAMAAGEVPLLVAAVEGLLQRTLPPEELDRAWAELRTGGSYDLNQLAETLTAAGYSRCDQVEGVGQFALRGGILDVYSPGMEQPVRAEFFGDELDAMGLFDPATQRRTENVERAVLLPAAEALPHLAPGGTAGLAARLEKLAAGAEKAGRHELAQTLRQDREALEQGRSFPATDRYLALIYPQLATAADYLPPDACVLFSESSRVGERAKTYQWQLEEDAKSLMERGELDGSCAVLSRTFPELNARLSDWPTAYLDSFTLSAYPVPPGCLLSVTAKQLPSFGASLETAVSDLDHYQRSGLGTLVLVSSEQRALNLQTLLREQGLRAAVEFQPQTLPGPGETLVSVGGLSAGMEYPEARLAVLTEGQGAALKKPRPRKAATNREKLKSYADLSPGDLVVHEHHGVGRYVGMVKMPVDGVELDYVKIAYAGSDVLYVPATQLDLVSKYIGTTDEVRVKLHRLGGQEWQKTKSRVRSAVRDIARELIALYAKRMATPGFAFEPDGEWQYDFERRFEYEETEDQLRCIDEIKGDMERSVPMDRLLCGDVGFGKTEVALRAAFKCVSQSKQCVLLVPTTILAFQHYNTIVRRFEGFPVQVEMLSRFRTPKQQEDVLRRTARGEVDILVGTHRMLSKDVKFHDLGLFIVDEEQRFGVAQKERVKELAPNVDVLTLSATPIPRTLNMAMSGIRDMSVIEEAPQDRRPVQTYVLEHDNGILIDAIRRELRRGGQVYYLHNRVETIERCAAGIQMRLPEARVGFAHGKMTEEQLSDIWRQVLEHELDILVCTTIIETGVDIPNVNTLIIENADRFGLSQLHQLRGRVGRSSRRAFAYLTFVRGKVLTDVASKRLEAIREFTEFGAGFKIAMRDMEIRGAGNLLGAQQHGHMEAVGYEMYLRLLSEAVGEEKGESTGEREAECLIDLQVSAHIPDSYISSNAQRLDIYRRIADIRTHEDSLDVYDELIDRFGEPPEAVQGLIDVALLRNMAAAAGIYEVKQQQDTLLLYQRKLDLELGSRMSAALKGRVMISAGSKPYFAVKMKKNLTPLDTLREALEAVRPQEETD